MRGFRFVLLRKEVLINNGTLSNGEDEQMLMLLEEKGWMRLADKTKPSILASVRDLLKMQEKKQHSSWTKRLEVELHG